MRQPPASDRARASLAYIGLALLAFSLATRRTCSNDKGLEAEHRSLSERPSALYTLIMGNSSQDFYANSLASVGDWFDYDTTYWQTSSFDDVRIDAMIGAIEVTRNKLASLLFFPKFDKLSSYQKSHMSNVMMYLEAHLYRAVPSDTRSQERIVSAGGKLLLGRYEVLLAVGYVHFDFEWTRKRIPEKPPRFFVAHAPALNLGESYDFNDFVSGTNKFDQSSYVSAMGRIVHLIMQVASRKKITDLVFFPFGMGASLRNLKDRDKSYADASKMQELRESLTLQFVAAFKSTPDIRIHVCLAFTPVADANVNEEMLANTAAFLSAFRSVSAADFRHKPTLWPDADNMQVALDLAKQSSVDPAKVMLVNGVNRKRIGNAWYMRGVAGSIDENLHRRSWMLSAISYFLNKGLEVRSDRQEDDLATQVRSMRGEVLDVEMDVTATGTRVRWKDRPEPRSTWTFRRLS